MFNQLIFNEMENLNVLLEIIAELREQNKELTTLLADKTESSTFWYTKYTELKNLQDAGSSN